MKLRDRVLEALDADEEITLADLTISRFKPFPGYTISREAEEISFLGNPADRLEEFCKEQILVYRKLLEMLDQEEE